jgi:DNA ligase-1
MTNFVQVIKACEAANGAGTKKAILDALKTADKDAQRLIKEALDPYRVFGIKKFDRLPWHEYSSTDCADVSVITRVLDDLASKKLTGNAARTAVVTMLAEFTPETSKYIERIIDKDLDAGFSADTVNKVFPDLVPTFSVMLADKFDTDEEVKANVPFPCLAEAKYDGERTIAVVTEKGVTYYSRSGKEAKHVDGLFDEDLQKMRTVIGYDIVVDGERYASDFTETVNAKKSTNDAAKANLRFYAFAYMSWAAWQNRAAVVDMVTMRAKLGALINEAGCTKVSLSKGIIAKTADEAEAFYKQMVKEGFEGLILKNVKAVYEWDRSKHWVKWKPFFDFDGVVIAVYEGKKGTRLEGLMGGVTLKGTDEHGRVVVTNVGSGFSDDDRRRPFEYWMGKVMEVKYQEITKAKDSDTWALRFPTYNRIRFDK